MESKKTDVLLLRHLINKGLMSVVIKYLWDSHPAVLINIKREFYTKKKMTLENSRLIRLILSSNYRIAALIFPRADGFWSSPTTAPDQRQISARSHDQYCYVCTVQRHDRRAHRCLACTNKTPHMLNIWLCQKQVGKPHNKVQPMTESCAAWPRFNSDCRGLIEASHNLWNIFLYGTKAVYLSPTTYIGSTVERNLLVGITVSVCAQEEQSLKFSSHPVQYFKV